MQMSQNTAFSAHIDACKKRRPFLSLRVLHLCHESFLPPEPGEPEMALAPGHITATDHSMRYFAVKYDPPEIILYQSSCRTLLSRISAPDGRNYRIDLPLCPLRPNPIVLQKKHPHFFVSFVYSVVIGIPQCMPTRSLDTQKADANAGFC
jgi:hypothetical protein